MSLSVDEIERTMNTYHTAWLVCMIAACVFLVAAVVLFIVFRIPRVFMNLTGIERKRQIKEITENVGTEAQTARHQSVQKRKTVQPEPPGVQQNSAYQMNVGQMQTTMLAGQNPSNIDSTVKLANSENTVLLSNNGGAGATDVLVAKAKPEKSTRSSVFNITQQIILVNTEEIIQL